MSTPKFPNIIITSSSEHTLNDLPSNAVIPADALYVVDARFSVIDDKDAFLAKAKVGSEGQSFTLKEASLKGTPFNFVDPAKIMFFIKTSVEKCKEQRKGGSDSHHLMKWTLTKKPVSDSASTNNQEVVELDSDDNQDESKSKQASKSSKPTFTRKRKQIGRELGLDQANKKQRIAKQNTENESTSKPKTKSTDVESPRQDTAISQEAIANSKREISTDAESTTIVSKNSQTSEKLSQSNKESTTKSAPPSQSHESTIVTTESLPTSTSTSIIVSNPPSVPETLSSGTQQKDVGFDMRKRLDILKHHIQLTQKKQSEDSNSKQTTISKSIEDQLLEAKQEVSNLKKSLAEKEQSFEALKTKNNELNELVEMLHSEIVSIEKTVNDMNEKNKKVGQLEVSLSNLQEQVVAKTKECTTLQDLLDKTKMDHSNQLDLLNQANLGQSARLENEHKTAIQNLVDELKTEKTKNQTLTSANSELQIKLQTSQQQLEATVSERNELHNRYIESQQTQQKFIQTQNKVREEDHSNFVQGLFYAIEESIAPLRKYLTLSRADIYKLVQSNHRDNDNLHPTGHVNAAVPNSTANADHHQQQQNQQRQTMYDSLQALPQQQQQNSELISATPVQSHMAVETTLLPDTVQHIEEVESFGKV